MNKFESMRHEHRSPVTGAWMDGIVKDSVQVCNEGGVVVWFSEGDFRPYWGSDSEGYEIRTFKTKDDAMKYVKGVGENANKPK